MAWDFRKTITSSRAKKLYLAFMGVFVLFFVCNDFLLPWYVNRGGIINVPSVTGRNVEDALRLLDSLGLQGRQNESRPDNSEPLGTVIIQNPLAGEKVKRGRRVYLTVSGGEQQVTVPSVKGRSIRDARFALEREGLKLGTIDYQPSDTFPLNTVVDQSIPAGTSTSRERYVSLVVSQGTVSQRVAVPNVSGKLMSEAVKILKEAGLQLGNITYLNSPNLLPNTVIEQFPKSGELVSTGQAIDLFIVQGGEKRKEIFEY